jgi:DNA-binding transcriptional MerR regulator
MTYTVGDVSRIARISVRALHHYDEIGLVRPTARSGAGYRLYTDSDLERLQQVLFFRELGFKLDEIVRILADPGFDRREALIAQRALLAERAEQARSLVELIDKTIAALDGGTTMKREEMFDGFDPAAHEEEARSRWGHTAEYAESMRRTKGYTKDDWAQIRAESNAITDAFAKAAEAGVAATDARAMDVAERHRQHIDRWFYPCSKAMHRGLGQMYVADERFAASYEKARAGLAQFICDAIAANAAR